ncbi:phosphotransferase [bacterium]|nr:phosphotransferase [bacterium]
MLSLIPTQDGCFERVRQYLLKLGEKDGLLFDRDARILELAVSGNCSMFSIGPTGQPPRLIAKVAPIFSDRRAELDRRIWAKRLVMRAGGNVPKVVIADCTLRTKLRHGFSVLVMEWIKGKSLLYGEMTAGKLGALAESLASVNAVSTGNGIPLRLIQRRVARKWLADKVDYSLKTLSGRPFNLSEGTCAVVRKRMLSLLDHILQKRTTNELVHGDINPQNVILRDDCASLVDFQKSRFLFFDLDIHAAIYRFCRTEEEVSLFLERYFEVVGFKKRVEFERDESFFRSFVLLRYSADCFRRVRDAKDRDEAEREREKAMRSWDAFTQVASG